MGGSHNHSPMNTTTERMPAGFTLLSELGDQDLEWFLTVATREKVPANTLILRGGAHVPSVYIVLNGLCRVYLASPGGKELALLGVGQIFGEMAFIADAVAEWHLTLCSEWLL